MIVKVTKGRNSEFPDSLKYAFSVWETIQDTKRNKKNVLNIMWLDLANSYSTVFYEIFSKSMDIFYLLEDLKL